MKRYCNLALLASLVLLACQLAGQIGQEPVEPASPPTASRERTPPALQASPSQPPTPLQTPEPETGNPTPATGSPAGETQAPITRPKPPQSQAAEIRPTEMRTELTHLSKLIGFQVLDENGENLGLASDYIVNTCETFVIYLLMEPAAELTIEPGGLVAIPYEAVTVNSGVLDAQNQAIQLRLQPGQLSGAPVISAGQPLTPTDWEEEVRAFWSQVVRIGSLKTSCNVPGGPVYKVAYASQLLGAALYDGRGEMLGTVQEAILAPESGKLAFYIVKPSSGEGLVMVRLAVTNIPKEALAPGGTLSLELLTEPQMFWQAPRITSLDEADGFTVQGKMLQYWGR